MPLVQQHKWVKHFTTDPRSHVENVLTFESVRLEPGLDVVKIDLPLLEELLQWAGYQREE